jgi:hypothetical protein
MNRYLLTGSVIVVFMPALLAASDNSAGVDYFEQHIRPVLVEHCYECHSQKTADAPRGGLRLDSSEAIEQGGDSGSVVVPGDADASLLIKALKYEQDDLQMPPDGKLDDATIAHFVHWVTIGAPDPRRPAEASERSGSRPEIAKGGGEPSHWAFQPPQETPLPRVRQQDWPINAVDSFLLDKLEQSQLAPSEMADDRTLARRLYYDLIGLPADYEQIVSFQLDASPDKYERLVDRLLVSPKFGERWGRYWLDIARFADTKGYVFTKKREYPDAFKYRDWVIRSFNGDLPYDRFVVAQLAADQIGESANDPDELAAMGYLTLGRRFLNNRHDIIDDRIDVTTRGFLGLTVTCARCHDHKYDPIPTEDYYSLYGVFASSREPGDSPSPLRLVDRDHPEDAYVLIRGNPDRRGAKVPRRFLKVISKEPRVPFSRGSGRLELAQHIADPANPLTSRVFVNRVWGHLFGRHLVETPSDFGLRSEHPVHQELLDHLAVDFVRHDWSLKWLVRELVTSRVYQQSSANRPECAAVDPENNLYWRMLPRRLDFEALRDSLLIVCGQLDDSQIGGPSVQIASKAISHRRSAYSFIDRQNFPSLFRAFDVAIPDQHSPKRFETTVPQQALFLLNHPTMLEMADRATRLIVPDDSSRHDIAAGVTKTYRQILNRDPTPDELDLGIAFLAESGDGQPDTDVPTSSWARYAQVLMVSNEFVFVD